MYSFYQRIIIGSETFVSHKITSATSRISEGL
jgi:hypothetical protein